MDELMDKLWHLALAIVGIPFVIMLLLGLTTGIPEQVVYIGGWSMALGIVIGAIPVMAGRHPR